MSHAATAWAWNQLTETPGAKFILLALAECANSRAGGYTFPSQSQLSRMTGQGVRTVYRHLIELLANGLIKADPTGRGWWLNFENLAPNSPGQDGSNSAKMADSDFAKMAETPGQIGKAIGQIGKAHLYGNRELTGKGTGNTRGGARKPQSAFSKNGGNYDHTTRQADRRAATDHAWLAGAVAASTRTGTPPPPADTGISGRGQGQARAVAERQPPSRSGMDCAAGAGVARALEIA